MSNTVPLHPEIEPLKDQWPPGDIDAETLAARREMRVAEPPELSDAVERVDHEVSGDPPVKVRVHRPVGVAGALPCLFSIHGGGYVMGSYEMDDPKFDRWCPKYGIVGVSVEYRLAPEHSYPAALDDCYAALEWTFDNADLIGADPERIGITGVSAGGGLCAALALRARDEGKVPVRFQLLDCPMLDDRQVTPSSRLDDLLVWTIGSNEFGWRSYLGPLYGAADVPAYAAPARAHDLSGLPEAYVCVGGADGFRDEDIDYAQRLYAAGVETELHVYPGAPHGVSMFVGTDIAWRYRSDQEDWLRRRFEA